MILQFELICGQIAERAILKKNLFDNYPTNCKSKVPFCFSSLSNHIKRKLKELKNLRSTKKMFEFINSMDHLYLFDPC